MSRPAEYYDLPVTYPYTGPSTRLNEVLWTHMMNASLERLFSSPRPLPDVLDVTVRRWPRVVRRWEAKWR